MKFRLFVRLSDTETPNADIVIYQSDESVLSAKWNYSDPEHLHERDDNINSIWFAVGSFPLSDDLYERTFQTISPDNEGSLPAGSVRPAVSGNLYIIYTMLHYVLELTEHILNTCTENMDYLETN